MPIVSISKIQHRYGLTENLPQLSAAELGWAIDQRRLFIGNGPTSEGAPSVGNTEILTQYSNLLQIAENAYSYKDGAVGFEAITGPSLAAPTTRSLQEKLDDFANVRDYGAVGNGIADDTVAINRAIADMFTRQTTTPTRRVLYFPAGTYNISGALKVPPFATLQGEGKNCTIIVATNNSASCVVRLTDSKLQFGASVGTNGALLPSHIAINDMTFSGNALGIDVLLIDSAKYTAFRRVSFLGGLTQAPSTAGSAKAAVKITSTAINHSSNIVFDDCDFQGINYAAIVDDDMENIVFDKCSFKLLYIGIKVGENTTGAGSSVIGPVGFRITNSLFDQIYGSGLVNYQDAQVTSAFNTYIDVGNRRLSNPTYPNISFAGDGGASICDTFTRTNTENITSPRISYAGNRAVVVNGNTGIQVGKRSIAPGGTIILANNISSPTTTGITLAVPEVAITVHYMAVRDDTIRNGYVEVTVLGTDVTVSDNFTENGPDMGLTFSATLSGSMVSLLYKTSNTGFSVSFSYSVDRNLA